MLDGRVRRANSEDQPPLLTLWERSVRATHRFLEERDIVALRPAVAAELASDVYDWWVLESTNGVLVGMLGYATDAIEGLFVDADYHGRGVGTALVAHAQRLSSGTLAVDVNEQNDGALRFYQRLGFVEVGRSQTDSYGRSFPTLHLRREAGAIAR